ncbi:MAG: relaxase [Halothiobacillus sp. 14-56-357]|nr:MAG: relaxase [Halothiobacillus sp. 14-56-357]
MKAKVTRGTGFRGVLDYALDTGNQKGKNPEIVGGTLTSGSARAMSDQFAVTRRLRPDIKSPVWHASLALPEGERLSSERWSSIADDFMQEMGFPSESLYTVIRHNDTKHDHIHIIASRVSLSGGLWHGQWEVYRAIRATQVLERIHGLTLTPGLGEPKDEKTLTKGEIEQALRTGAEAPRQRLQRLVKEAAQGKPTAVMFAERLELAGVGVRFQIQKTGITGVNYELDGLAFKGQSLGDSYKWSKFSKKYGVSYEQARDSESLERYTTAIADRTGRDELGNAGRSLEVDAGFVTPSSSRADSRSTGAVGEAEGGGHSSSDRLRQSDRSTAPDTGGIDSADEYQRSGSIRAEGREAGQNNLRPVTESVGAEIEHRHDGEDRTEHRDDPGSTQEISASHDNHGERTERGGEIDTTEDLASDTGTDLSQRNRWDSGAHWASRFKQASAAKRGGSGMAQGDTRGTRVAEPDRQSAREIDPTVYLEGVGYSVRREGRHLSVRLHGDEVYRGTLKPYGHYVWCDLYQNGIDDNIDLINQIEPGSGYANAVYKLLGAPSVSPRPERVAPKRQPPRLPDQDAQSRASGRAYLVNDRGISIETIDHAEACGILRYAQDGVLFVGYDDVGTAQSITQRSTSPTDLVQKHDLRGSDKSYSPILPGDQKIVWIVEGGADALALHDLYRRRDRQPLTVLVSGGANVRGFLDRPEIQAMMKQAECVVIAGENELGEATQKRTDAAHQKQVQRVAEITGRAVKSWKPKPDQGKDLADVNYRQQREMTPVPPMDPDHRTEASPSQVMARDLILGD